MMPRPPQPACHVGCWCLPSLRGSSPCWLVARLCLYSLVLFCSPTSVSRTSLRLRCVCSCSASTLPSLATCTLLPTSAGLLDDDAAAADDHYCLLLLLLLFCLIWCLQRVSLLAPRLSRVLSCRDVPNLQIRTRFVLTQSKSGITRMEQKS